MYASALDEEGDIYLASSDDTTRFILFPPFPSEELAQTAIDNVGKERIIAAMRTLANVKE